MCRPVKICPGLMPVCGLVVGKLSARGSLTTPEANVPAFLLDELLAKSFPPKCQELWVKPCQRVWENADHSASSGAQRPGSLSLPLEHCPRVGKQGLSWSLQSSREDMRAAEVPPLKCKVQAMRSPEGAGLGARGTHTAPRSATNMVTRRFESFNPSKCVTKIFIF